MLGKTQNKIFMEHKITKLKLSVFIFHFISYMCVIFYTGFAQAYLIQHLVQIKTCFKYFKR